MTTGEAPLSARSGYLTVKAVTRFTDSDGRAHWPDDGAVDVMPEADRRLVITKNRWAEVVAA